MSVMTGRDAEQDPIREAALDWLIGIEAAPDDRALRAAALAWRQEDPAHETAWQSVARTWRLAGNLPPDYAERTRDARFPKSSSDPRAPSGRAARTRSGSLRPPASGRRAVSPLRRVALAATGAALAACLAVFALEPLRLSLEADYTTGVGETRRIVLNDGSAVHLNAESAVAVDYGPARRSVRLLSGQAFFEVASAPERPFTVPADGLSVTVTGTEFAVGRRAAETSVAVQSGTVEVALDASDGEPARLARGDRLSLTRESGDVAISRVDPDEVASWRSGRLSVDGMLLADLVEALDRYHRGVIWLRDAELASRRVTGVFNLQDPVGALTAAAETQDAEVTEVTPYLVIVTAR